MAIKKGLLVGIIVAAVVLVLLAVGVGTVMSIHNSTYDCSFVYVQPEDLIKEIATKHTYYDADTKTVEVEITQDLINSLIKDNFENLDIALPDKFSINDILFNTKDQRLYINGKYGSINIPLSAKLNVDLSSEGIVVTATDLNLGNKKAPGMISNQIPSDALTYSFNYADFDLPNVFTVNDIQFGSGILKVYVELLPDGIKSMAMDYRNQALDEIDSFKRSQSEFINNFITKLMDSTGLLSDKKVNEFIDFVLDNGEILNSAIHFALTDDFSHYTKQFETVQKAVTDWVAPLSVIQYYGSIDETYDTIIHDQKLKELVAWFLPEDKINEYIDTAGDYYSMYEEYYGLYEEILDMKDDLESTFASLSFSTMDSIEETVASIQNKIFRNSRLINLLSDYMPTDAFGEISDTIDEYLALYHEYLDLYDETLSTIASTASDMDTGIIDEYADLILEYLNQTEDTKDLVVDVVSQVDAQLVKDLVHYIENFGQFGRDFIATIHPDNYATFREVIDNLELYQEDTIAITKDIDTSSLITNVETVKDINAFATEVVTMLENKEVLEAIDILMNKDFAEYKFVEPEVSSYEFEFVVE